jgi:hypothetical protein
VPTTRAPQADTVAAERPRRTHNLTEGTMTTTAQTQVHHPLVAPATWTGVTTAALLIVGSFVDAPFGVHPERGWGIDTQRQGLGTLAAVVVIAAAGTIAVFAFLVPRLLDKDDPARTANRALITAAAAAFTLVVSWTGLPVILTAATLVLVQDSRKKLGQLHRSGILAPVIATLAFLAATYLAFAA